MSSQRSRAPRGGQRASGHDTGEEASLWARIQEDTKKIGNFEKRAGEVSQAIIDKESEIKRKGAPSIQDINELDALYRENVRIAETLTPLLRGPESATEKLTLLTAMVRHNEENAETSMGRGPNSRESYSRSAMELDGPADSPVASPVEPKPLRKVGGGRTSSQPPRDTPFRADNAQPSEGTVKTKVTFDMGAQVAFKPKVPGSEDRDWIQGVVVKVIGEGKSRRYDVQDPFPDENTKRPGQVYRSSASSMIPVPPPDAVLPDYEKGRHVLALYPDTTAFYRAEVISMKGDKVELMFEGDEQGKHSEVERRWVFDHKG